MASVSGPLASGLRGAVDLAPLVARSAQAAVPAPTGSPSAGSAAAPNASGLVLQVGDADFTRVVELSSTVPVIVALVASWSTPSGELVETLTRVIESLGGRIVLATIDTDANPQLADAFKAESIPTVAAVIAGRPVSLFAGTAPEPQIRDLMDQVLVLAEQNGVTGRVATDAMPGEAEQVEPPLPPLHAEAYDAIDRADYVEAARLFRTAIAQDPRDLAAVAALAQVELLGRLADVDAASIRARAADEPNDADAALAVADLDISGGHVEDAFDRLLTLFAGASAEHRTPVRTRLLDYFEIVGTDDPRVATARRRLASLLY